ncbi:MAG: ATP-binding cassette domain-containing protein [Bacteroidales bacterium]|nr:ATP-binding cassette domain-containing protein [Bacteroidales bacterium]MBN2820105.1 ATP-binding cassette domain-containing protein [Bacteroidales bacterium]
MKVEVPKKKITLAGLKNLSKLYHYMKPYRIQYFVGIFFLIGSSAASLAFPKLLGDLINVKGVAQLAHNLNRLAIILGIVLVVQAAFSYFRIVLFVNVAERTLANLRQSIYNHLIQLPMKFFQKRRVGELNSRISADITQLQDTLTTTLAEFLRQIIIILGGITLLLITSPKLTLFMLSVLPLIMILATFFGKYIRKLSKKAQSQVAESNTIVEETLQGIQSVKTYTNEFFEMNRYQDKVKAIARTGIRNGKLRGAFSSFLIMGMFGSIVAVMWKGSTLMASGELDTGDLFSFIIYTIFIAGSISGLASVFGQVQKFLGATEDLLEIFQEEKEELSDPYIEPEIQKIGGLIQIKNLDFCYPNRTDVIIFNKLNLTIEANKTTAIVGSSGAGKTTLISLLLRLYEPTSGSIYFDSLDSKEIPLSHLRKQMALVPQDIFLFGGTILENIGYGKNNANEQEIKHAAKMANAYDFIEEFPEKFKTLVGERGTQLSGGQRQRIAIARALLKDPKILILDEATSSLDSESEKLVQDALDKLMIGRTSIVIAHRLSTIRKADKILVLDKGQLVEVGTHEELLRNSSGIYKRLNELQFAN